MTRQFPRGPIMHSMAVLAASMLVVCSNPTWGQEPPTSDEPDARSRDEGTPPEDDRGYQSKRKRSLNKRERFEPRSFSSSPTPANALREFAASEGYDRGFEDGFEEGYRAAQQAIKGNRLATLHDAAMTQATEHFRSGRYGAAARNFLLAAKSDQGDPLSRLNAAHAMAALQHYSDAFLLIRRAFQLQPNLVYVPIDIREAYTNQAEFKKHLDKLTLEANSTKDDAELWALLGYYRFFSEQQADALRALRRAAQLAPSDPFVAKLMNAARISTPASQNPNATPRTH